jgi:hypothetical protein
VKFMLRTLAATALMVLAADVCQGATARSSLTSKQLKAATRLAHPQAPKGSRLNRVPRNTAVRTAPAASAQKTGTGAAVVATRNASTVGATAAVPGVPAVQASAFRVKPLPPVAADHDAVISGTGFKHSLSTLASVGGAATGKGTAVINGTSVRPKQPH